LLGRLGLNNDKGAGANRRNGAGDSATIRSDGTGVDKKNLKRGSGNGQQKRKERGRAPTGIQRGSIWKSLQGFGNAIKTRRRKICGNGRRKKVKNGPYI